MILCLMQIDKHVPMKLRINNLSFCSNCSIISDSIRVQKEETNWPIIPYAAQLVTPKNLDITDIFYRRQNGCLDLTKTLSITTTKIWNLQSTVCIVFKYLYSTSQSISQTEVHRFVDRLIVGRTLSSALFICWFHVPSL